MPCSWATGTQKDVWQRLYNSLPFPEVLSFSRERWISMVIHFKNKDQSVSMSVPKTKSITLTALTPPPQMSQATSYGWRELAAFLSLSLSYWSLIRFATWYISIHGISYSSLYNVRETFIANVLFMTETMDAAICSRARCIYQQKLWPPSVNV